MFMINMRYSLVWWILRTLARLGIGWEPIDRWPPDDPRDEFLQLERNRYTGSRREMPR